MYICETRHPPPYCICYYKPYDHLQVQCKPNRKTNTIQMDVVRQLPLFSRTETTRSDVSVVGDAVVPSCEFGQSMF